MPDNPPGPHGQNHLQPFPLPPILLLLSITPDNQSFSENLHHVIHRRPRLASRRRTAAIQPLHSPCPLPSIHALLQHLHAASLPTCLPLCNSQTPSQTPVPVAVCALHSHTQHRLSGSPTLCDAGMGGFLRRFGEDVEPEGTRVCHSPSTLPQIPTDCISPVCAFQ